MSGTILNNNKATHDGGSLSLESVKASSIQNSNFTNSEADGRGGAILLSDSAVQMLSSNVNGSSANAGGAFAVVGTSKLLMTDTSVLKSMAKSHAGGVAELFSCEAKVRGEIQFF